MTNKEYPERGNRHEQATYARHHAKRKGRPMTQADHQAIMLAQVKRQRKAAKRAKEAAGD